MITAGQPKAHHSAGHRPPDEVEPQRVRRVSGGNRYETAAAISAATFPDGYGASQGVGQVMIAASSIDVAEVPDELAAAAWAGFEWIPYLLTYPDRIPNSTAAELQRLRPDRIVVIGGPNAVSETVIAQLQEHTPYVERVFGTNRYDTAVEISQKWSHQGGQVVYLASGLTFVDSIGGAAAAGYGAVGQEGVVLHEAGPLLLTGQASLAPQTATELTRLAPTRIVVLGGENAIGAAVIEEINTLLPQTAITRHEGSNRFATAANTAIAEYNTDVQINLQTSTVYVVSGREFVDGAISAANAIVRHAPILLTEQDTLPPATRQALTTLCPHDIIIIGGPTVINEQVFEELKTYPCY